MPRKKASCLNKTVTMKNGMKATCVAYREFKDMDILFEDGTLVQHIQKHHFYNGTVVNPNSTYNPYKTLSPLSITNPELLKEWDYEENSVSPEEITRSYKIKVHWKCENGHKWKALVTTRTRKHQTGCPYCSGNLPVAGVNDFETSNPELMLDWDYAKNIGIDPKNMTAYSGTRVYWKCHFCGYEWETAANNRSSQNRGCPNCSMKSTSFGEQALYFYIKKLFPDAINRYREGKFELDVFIPSIKTGIEFDGAFFHKGKENEEREKRKFEICSNLGITLIRLKDSNSLGESNNADLVLGIENLKDKANLNKIIRIVLSELDYKSNPWTRSNPLQVWSSIDSEIDVDKDYFDIVENRYLRDEENNFIKYKPELIEDWDYEKNKTVNPRSITRGCGFLINWKCHECGYEWKARVGDRIKGDGCPCCNRRVLVEGVNDFATLHPDSLDEWDYDNNKIPPSKIASYKYKASWKCKKCGFKWEATINDKIIREDRTGCPNCARKAIAKKRHERALEKGRAFVLFPELKNSWLAEKNPGVDVFDISVGSATRYWWKCQDCGNEWQSSPHNRLRGGKISRCPKCKFKHSK